MSISTYYRYVIWLPVLLPLVALPSFFLASPHDPRSAVIPIGFTGPASISWLLVTSLIWGGLPYVFTLALHYRVLLDHDEQAQQVTVWTLPLRMVLVQCGFYLICFLIINLLAFLASQDITWSVALDGLIDVLLFTGAATLVLGYLYVLVAQAALWFLVRIRVVRSSARIFAELRSPVSRFTEISGQ